MTVCGYRLMVRVSVTAHRSPYAPSVMVGSSAENSHLSDATGPELETEHQGRPRAAWKAQAHRGHAPCHHLLNENQVRLNVTLRTSVVKTRRSVYPNLQSARIILF